MADELFDRGYADGAFREPGQQNMSNMQRFLQEKETYFAGRRVYDEKQSHFHGGCQSPMGLEFYGAPHPWPQNVQTTHALYPQEIWSREWAPSDQGSCSATTGNTWSPQATESCSDHDQRYASWPEPHVYPAECMYPAYGSDFTHGGKAPSPHSVTATLSEIQQYPDNEAEGESMNGRIQLPHPSGSDSALRLGSRMVDLHRDEGIGSSINESAVASPVSQIDTAAMESASGDGEESDYSPQNRSKRAPKKQKGRTKSGTKSSTSSTSKRSSMTKANPHQLTAPAKIAKRTSSVTKPSSASTSPTSPHTSHTSNSNDYVCQQCKKAFPSVATLQKHILSAHTRPFHCSFRRYGCTSTFGSKNEWKRHVSSQHLCPGIYRCDIGPCVPHAATPSARSDNNDRNSSSQQSSSGWSHNDFNRKDLFTQHIRRMHGPGSSAPRSTKDAFENTLDAIRRRCWIPLRDSPPKSICGYCAPHSSRSNGTSSSTGNTSSSPAVRRTIHFSGRGSWDDRMEHVGRHLERENPGFEVEDGELRDWMVGEGLCVWEGGQCVVKGLGGRRRAGRGAATGAGGGGAVEEEDGEEDADGEDE
ncbi:MAG: hypothetical protein Q9216_003335 [Gyalolechia sp. 2 TL-2023]